MQNQSIPAVLGIAESRSNELFVKLQQAYDNVVSEESKKSDVIKLVLDITQDPREVAMLCFFMGEMWGSSQLDPMEGGIIIAMQEPEPEDPGFSAN